MFNLGMSEIVVILIVALVFLGPKKLPELASGIGKMIRELRKATADIKSEIELDETIRRPLEELREATMLPPEELKRRDLERAERAAWERQEKEREERERLEQEAREREEQARNAPPPPPAPAPATAPAGAVPAPARSASPSGPSYAGGATSDKTIATSAPPALGTPAGPGARSNDTIVTPASQLPPSATVPRAPRSTLIGVTPPPPPAVRPVPPPTPVHGTAASPKLPPPPGARLPPPPPPPPVKKA